jgi:DNA-binding transcriptional LysR family regulator
MLPSLRGLEALTALSRHGSLTAAAQVLGVTRSALSHRIADLEGQLGVAMIARAGQRVRLTDDAEALLTTIGDALERIHAAVAPIKRRWAQLRVSTVSTFASCWLLPRLAQFRVLYPDVEIALASTRRVVDLDSEESDCAIRHGLGDWPGLTSTLLFRETLAPVAAPRADHNLHGTSIIWAKSRYRDWPRWWNACGRRGAPEANGLIVETRAQALEAAIAGMGIAMMDMAYVEPLIAQQRLVTLGPSIALKEGYYFVCGKMRRNARLVAAFRNWVVDAAGSGLSIAG